MAFMHGAVMAKPAATFSPSQLSPIAWYDASNAGSISSSGGLVSQWNDLSGNGRHLGIGGTRPTTGTRTQNGLNALDFGGTHSLTVGSVTLAQPYTVCTVAKYDAGIAGSTVIVSLAELNAYAAYSSSGNWAMYNSTVLSGSAADTSAHCLTSVANGASSLVRVDQSQVASGNAGSTAGSRINVGAANSTAGFGAGMDGYVCEIVIVSGALTGTNLSNLENYMKTKWGTP